MVRITNSTNAARTSNVYSGGGAPYLAFSGQSSPVGKDKIDKAANKGETITPVPSQSGKARKGALATVLAALLSLLGAFSMWRREMAYKVNQPRSGSSTSFWDIFGQKDDGLNVNDHYDRYESDSSWR